MTPPGSTFVGAEPQAAWQLLSAHEEPVTAEFFDGAADEDRELREALEDLLLEGLLLNPAKVARAQRAAAQCWDGAASENREAAAAAAAELVIGRLNGDETPTAAAAYLGGHPAASAVQNDVPRWKAGVDQLIAKVAQRAIAQRTIASCVAILNALDQDQDGSAAEKPPERARRR